VQPIDERILFIDHQGKRILIVNFSKCSAKEVERVSRSVPDFVTVEPRGSVLVLTDFTGASFDHDALRTMQETAVFDKPFVKKSALIGTETLPKEFYEQNENLLPSRTANFCNSRRSFSVAGRRIDAASRAKFKQPKFKQQLCCLLEGAYLFAEFTNAGLSLLVFTPVRCAQKSC
jgi:hypothetical protein